MVIWPAHRYDLIVEFRKIIRLFHGEIIDHKMVFVALLKETSDLVLGIAKRSFDADARHAHRCIRARFN
jgi:hypothetical protein